MSENIGKQTDNGQIGTEPKTSNVDMSATPSTSGQKTAKDNMSVTKSKKPDDMKMVSDKLQSLPHFVGAISLAMAIVVAYALLMGPIENSFVTHPIVVFKDKDIDSHSDKFLLSLVNALVIIVLVAILTSLMVALFYFRLARFLNGFLFVSITLTLFVLFNICFVRVLKRFNTPFDWVSAYLLIWNYAVIALISIFWKGPKIVQQMSLILITAITAIILIGVFPDWTTWALLMALVIWDLIAVLCPYGPLNLLIKIHIKRAQEEEDYSLPPGMLYTTMIWMSTTYGKTEQNPNPSKETQESNPVNTEAQEANEGQKNEVKFGKKREKEGKEEETKKERKGSSGGLGLGDFVFYSVLMGKVTVHDDFNLIVGCYVAIVFGLILTSMLLVVFKRALPALPISIVLALIVFFTIKFSADDFLNQLSVRLIFV